MFQKFQQKVGKCALVYQIDFDRLGGPAHKIVTKTVQQNFIRWSRE